MGIRVKTKDKPIRELLVGKPIVIIHPNSVIIWKQSSERGSNKPEVTQQDRDRDGAELWPTETRKAILPSPLWCLSAPTVSLMVEPPSV